MLPINLLLRTLKNTAPARPYPAVSICRLAAPKGKATVRRCQDPPVEYPSIKQTAILKAASAPSFRPRTSCGGLSRHDPSAIRQARPATVTSNGGGSRDPRGVRSPPNSANCDRCCRPVSPRFAQALAPGEVVSNTGASQSKHTAGAAQRRMTMLPKDGAAPAVLFKCKRRPA